MRLLINLTIATFGLILSGCVAPTETAGIATQASEQNLSVARRAVTTCERAMPDNKTAYATLLQQGFSVVGQDQRLFYLLSDGGGVSVAISRFDKLQKLCAVTVADMSSAQGVQLIQPWVALINGVPNETLSRKAAAAWGGRLGEDRSFVAVIKQSIFKEIDGAWVRMIVIDR